MDMAKGSTASLVLVGTLLVTASSVLSYGDFARYQSIVSRHPFGDVPVVSAPRPAAPAPTPAAESFAKALRMSAITDSAAGLRVGFSDIKVKPERHYYLGVGDIQDGYHVVDANYAKEAALIRKGEEEVWISMDGSISLSGPGLSVAGTPGASSLASESVRVNRSRLIQNRSDARELRLLAKAEAVLDRQQATPVQVVEELYRQHQMQLIRAKGALGPALPMQLTKEMDRQLVAEGVLPASE